MSNDTDDRKIEDILFAQEDSLLNRESFCAAVRRIFLDRGARTAQDVIDLGCTGLVGAPVDMSIPDEHRLLYKENSPVAQIAFARGRMAGAGFGIPCYVPPTQFCFVHNTVGGLQPNQAGRHPEGLNLCSRPLTLEEQGHTADVQALINKEGAAKTKLLFGAERVEPETPKMLTVEDSRALNQYLEARCIEEMHGCHPCTCDVAQPVESATVSTAPAAATVPLDKKFVCPEHDKDTMIWTCRYCLAAGVINGPLQPDVFVEYRRQDKSIGSAEIENLGAVLGDEGSIEVTAFVRVKCWKRQMVEINE